MISVTVLTRDSSRFLREVLNALESFDEILIYDNGSKDNTLEIASSFSNVTLHKGEFLGFGPSHNHASQLARNDWIFSIDSDEIVTPELVNEISKIKLMQGKVYSFNRHNYYNGKLIKWCGWYPDRVIRLYNRKDTEFTESQVHETVSLRNVHHIPLSGAIIHYSYSSVSEFIAKMQSYSELFAVQNTGIKSTSITKAIGSSIFTFIKCFIIKKGFLGGYEGLLISAYMANTAL